MFCSNCGKIIDDDSKFCPFCAAKVETAPKPEAPSAQDTTQAPAQVQSQAQNTPQPQYEQYAQTQEPIPETYESGSNKKVKRSASKKKALIAIIAAAIVVVAGALAAVFNFARISNFFARSFMKPESYYQYVEKKNTKTFAKNVSEIYNNGFLENVAVTGGKGRISMYVDIDNKAREFLTEQTEMDFSWLKKAEFVLENNVRDEKAALTLELILNDQSIATVDLIEDSKNGDILGRIPLISDEYFSTNLSELLGGASQYGSNIDDDFGYNYSNRSIDNLFGTTSKVKGALPDSETVQKILSRYIEILLNSVDKADKGSSELTAAGVSAIYNTIEIKIDDDIIQNVVKNICKELVKDKDIKKIINDIENAIDEELYDDFIDLINELADEADDIKLDENINMILWVNGKGEVAGREITIGDYRLKYAMPISGKDFGFELSYKEKADDNKFSDVISFTGSGTRSGNKIDGSFSFKTTNTKYVAVEYSDEDYGYGFNDYKLQKDTFKVFTVKVKDYDVEKANEGYINGTFIFKLDSEFVKYIGASADIEPLLTGAEIKVNVATEANKSDIKLSFSIDGDNYFSVGFTYTEASSSDAIPSASDAADILKWAEGIDIEAVLTKLKDNLVKAGVPSDFIDSIEEEIEQRNSYSDDWDDWGDDWNDWGDDWNDWGDDSDDWSFNWDDDSDYSSDDWGFDWNDDSDDWNIDWGDLSDWEW